MRELAINDEISIGDYVLTGGELAAMVLIDAVVRQIPGVLGAEGAQDRDSHADGLLEGPHYTRPAEFRGLGYPGSADKRAPCRGGSLAAAAGAQTHLADAPGSAGAG